MKTDALRLNGVSATRASGAGNDIGTAAGSDATEAGGDFSALLDSTPLRAPRPRPPLSAPARPAPEPRSSAAADGPPRPAVSDDPRPHADDAAARPTRADHARTDASRPRADESDHAESAHNPPPRHASAEHSEATDDKNSADNADSTGDAGASREEPRADAAGAIDAPWPPAALGGLEAMLTCATPLPASQTAAPPAPLAAPMTALLQGQGAAVAGASPALADACAATALPTTAASGTLIDTITAAATIDADPAIPATTSTLFALPTLPTVLPGADAANNAVFDATPTPMPNLADGFDDAVGARLSWLAEHKIGHAHIKLNPDNLGPIEVHLQLDGDKVSASFSSAHGEVRQALEQSLPRLRDLLGQQGFQLAHADVGGQASHGRSSNTHGEFPGSSDGTATEGATGGVGIPAATLRLRGLLDAYA